MRGRQWSESHERGQQWLGSLFYSSLGTDSKFLPISLWFIFNIFIHKLEKLNLQFSLVLMIHNAFQALNFDISKIKRVLDTRIFTKIKVLIEQKWPFCHFSLFLYSKKRQKFAHWLHFTVDTKVIRIKIELGIFLVLDIVWVM